jgi:hypothetical protein
MQASAEHFREILQGENERIPVRREYRRGVVDALIGLQAHACIVSEALTGERACADTAPREHRP